MTRRFPGFQLHQHLRQLGVAGGAGNQTDVRSAFEDALAFLLRDAAENAEYFALAGGALELLEPVKTFCSALSRMLQVL